MRRILLTLALLAPIEASAMSSEQGRFARNFAMLVYAQRRCPQLRVNDLALAQAVVQFHLPKGALDPGGEIFGEAEGQMSKLDGAFGGQSDKTFCAMMEDGFGPGGSIAEGFLKRR